VSPTKKGSILHNAKEGISLRVVGVKDHGRTLVVQTRLGTTGRFGKSLSHASVATLTKRRGWVLK
jgi:hypothetical protein